MTPDGLTTTTIDCARPFLSVIVRTSEPALLISIGIACGKGDATTNPGRLAVGGHGVLVAITLGSVFLVTVKGELSTPDFSAIVITVPYWLE